MAVGKIALWLGSLWGTLTLTGCASTANITVVNPSDVDRVDEMVEVPLSRLGRVADKIRPGVGLKDGQGQIVPTQITHDSLLIFPVSLKAHGKATFRVEPGLTAKVQPVACGRQYPERLDDMAWENDKSAYRAYGPALQRTGERSYGYDIMVKRVGYPVLEKRYAMELDAKARKQIADWRKAGERAKADSLNRIISYHVDHGDGMDCYNVGPTLGGGTAALWVDSAIVFPYCYKEYEILDNGPLRFTVKLTYGPATVGGNADVVETRVITLDAGSYLNRTDVSYRNLADPTPMVAGIVLHPQNPDGYRYDRAQSYVAYADSTNNAKAGNGVIYIGVVFPDALTDAGVAQGHVLGFGQYRPGTAFRYYWGSGWSKGGVAGMDEWCDYLTKYPLRWKEPLQIKIKR